MNTVKIELDIANTVRNITEYIFFYLRPCRVPLNVPLVDGSDGQSGLLYLHHSPPLHNGHLHIEQTKMEHKSHFLNFLFLCFWGSRFQAVTCEQYNSTTVLQYGLEVLLHFLISCGKSSHCHYPSQFTVTPQFSQCNTPVCKELYSIPCGKCSVV